MKNNFPYLTSYIYISLSEGKSLEERASLSLCIFKSSLLRHIDMWRLAEEWAFKVQVRTFWEWKEELLIVFPGQWHKMGLFQEKWSVWFSYGKPKIHFSAPTGSRRRWNKGSSKAKYPDPCSSPNIFKLLSSHENCIYRQVWNDTHSVDGRRACSPWSLTDARAASLPGAASSHLRRYQTRAKVAHCLKMEEETKGKSH